MKNYRQIPGAEKGYQPHSSIRLGDWKAIYFYEVEGWALFHLGRDIEEGRNLAPTQAEVLPMLAGILKKELNGTQGVRILEKELRTVLRKNR